MSRRRRFFKPVFTVLRSLWADFQKASKTSNAAIASLAKLKEETVTTRGTVVRKRLKTSNYFNPIFWVLQSFWFVARYLTSRAPVAGLQGLPALAGMVAPLLAGIWLTPSVDQKAGYARERMSFYAEHEQFEKADFFARQLCTLTANSPSDLLARAVLLDKMDRTDEAIAIAAQLGNTDKYLPAVEWMTEKELKAISDSGSVDEQRDQQLLTGLRWILQIQPDHLKANLMLGTFHMMRGQFTSALPLLRKVAELSNGSIPEAQYSLAVVQKNLGQTSECKVAASFASDGFLERDSQDAYSIQNVLQTLRALVMAEREPEAVAMLLQTMPQRNEQEVSELKWLLGEVYAQWGKRLRLKSRRSSEELSQAVDVMHRALAAAPNNPVVTEELIALSCTKELEDAMLDGQLQVALNSGISPGLIHFVRGTRLLMTEEPDADSALQHFELAMAHDSAMPGLLNNMADAMVESPTVELHLALRLIEQAIVMMPNQPHFYDTRGKILLKQHEPLKAIADFEKALAAPEIRGLAHEKLSEAYKTMGNEKESQHHQQMALQYKKTKE